ncbi:hypothetical protein ABFS82_04G016700 [Erythranthe guttata]|uniref:Uncharacterized protein n=1 Tax=Erythranthe guttata TaxID=4155 RepID=A0A022S384_ERYGU|nr:PREDICTED: zinc finger protein CONSTANS-LIKE 13 [Erythranthe guttata]EYU46711.1 hypothetical protein MIMGU_mgv1a009095mg [Erythranthe guttata]|eukprot:XP_012833433.1 PREDICTED: zinc finger protein CONSTANS-LIKE 13 [Erythranthe guttata]
MTEQQQTDRLCDFCNESKALLYCRADSAKLCLKCDLEVHSTNQLFRKHSRSLLCDSCNSSPASIFCSTESAVLCQNCDWETHNNARSAHDRRPLEGFNGCPSLTELLGYLGLEDLGKKSFDFGGENDGDWLDLLVWETPSIASLDDLIASNDCADSSPSFQAMGVPPLPKNRNAVCGQHKEEIFCQLRAMAKKDPNFSGSLEDLELQVPGKCEPDLENNTEPISVPSYETNELKWSSFTSGVPDDEGFPSSNFIDSLFDMNHLVPDKDSDFGDGTDIGNGFEEIHHHVPVDSKPFEVPPPARELNSHERDSAISRYKEKKKTRRYDKHIRYESRKARAESRTRVKGRFAKIDR